MIKMIFEKITKNGGLCTLIGAIITVIGTLLCTGVGLYFKTDSNGVPIIVSIFEDHSINYKEESQELKINYQKLEEKYSTLKNDYNKVKEIADKPITCLAYETAPPQVIDKYNVNGVDRHVDPNSNTNINILGELYSNGIAKGKITLTELRRTFDHCGSFSMALLDKDGYFLETKNIPRVCFNTENTDFKNPIKSKNFNWETRFSPDSIKQAASSKLRLGHIADYLYLTGKFDKNDRSNQERLNQVFNEN